MTLLRSVEGCERQYDHCDRAKVNSLRGKELSDTPLVALIALEDGARLIIEGHEYAINVNEMLIFRGDLCHAGASYATCNTRLHVYIDPKGWKMNVYSFNCED